MPCDPADHRLSAVEFMTGAPSRSVLSLNLCIVVLLLRLNGTCTLLFKNVALTRPTSVKTIS